MESEVIKLAKEEGKHMKESPKKEAANNANQEEIMENQVLQTL